MFVDQWNNVAGGGCFSCTKLVWVFFFCCGCKLITKKHVSSPVPSKLSLIIMCFQLIKLEQHKSRLAWISSKKTYLDCV